MAHTSALSPPSPEHRRIAASQFEHANRVVASSNYDYGIKLLLSCCKLDVANLIYRQALRRTEKAKYGNNLRGSWHARLTAWPGRARVKAALRSRDYLKVLEYGENVLKRNPWDVGIQMDMADAADNLGLIELAVWCLEQARQKAPHDRALNRALAHYYEKQGNFTQAMAIWQLVRTHHPSDTDAGHKLKDLAAHDTIARGRYAGVIPGNESAGSSSTLRPGKPAPPPSSSFLQPIAHEENGEDTTEEAPRSVGSSADHRIAREAAVLREKLEHDRSNANAYLQLANLYRRSGLLDQAKAILQEGLAPTGNAFELAIELADLDIEPFRQNLLHTEKKLKDEPNSEELRRIRTKLRKEINARELDFFRQKADRFPTELGLRFEVGVRLLRAGQYDEAIQMLQASRSDARFRWQSMLYLGHCFKARNNWRLAQRNFEEALQNLPAGETAAKKDLLFTLAHGCADDGDWARAVDLAHELANIDYAYRDISKCLDEWQEKLKQPKVSN